LLHDRVMDSGYQDNPVVGSALLSMHGRSGELDRAVEVFDRLRDPGLATYNAMLTQYVQHGRAMEALDLFKRMKRSAMKPNKVTLINLVEACSELESLEDGREIHRWIAALELESDLVVGTLLVNMYGSCGSTDDARSSFAKIKLKGVSLAAWNSMLGAYAQTGHDRHRHNQALLFFTEMAQLGVDPDGTTFVCLLNSLTHSGLLARSRDCFVDMVGEFQIAATSEHYGCVIDLLGRCGRLRQAEELMNTMPFVPDSMDWTSLLSASTTHSDRGIAEQSASIAAALDPANSAPYVLLSNV
ncbi:hypothetical protein SELMODRAFT_23607, partial [Selaginella moellendorffii]